MSPSNVSSAQSRNEVRPSNPRRGMKSYGLTCTLAALSLLALPSCAADPEKGDSDNDVNVAKASQEFKLMWPAALPRIQKFLAGNTLRVNLRGSDVTASNKASKQAILTQAIMAWVDAVRPVSRQPLITAADITWTSTNYDIDVNWAGESGRAMANCGVSGPAWMVLYHGDSFEVALHEFGHIFQVNDTYIEGVWTCQPGQPHSVMCDGPAFNTLQPDDIAGIRQVFRAAYPDLVPFSPLYSNLWTTEFGYADAAGGWRVDQHPRLMADVNSDGKADIVGFGYAGAYVALSNGIGFDPATLWVAEFGASSGWRVDRHPRLMADVNQDNRADIIGFGEAGTYVALSTGSGFQTPTLWTDWFGANSGWSVDRYPRLVADVNEDNRADIIGFGEAGTYVALSTGSGFQTPTLWVAEFGYSTGWRVESHPRVLAYVNDDKKADIVGFANGGVIVSLSTGTGFTAPALWVNEFGYNSGWRVESHPRFLADVNNDRMADIVGFGNAGAIVSLSTGAGFTAPALWVGEFGYNSGWRVESHPRFVADLNNDKKADIVGFANGGTMVSFSTGSGFTAAELATPAYGYDSGWQVSMHPRMLADVTGDGRPDIVGFGNDGAWVAVP